MEKTENQSKIHIKNPILRFIGYIIIAMAAGIGISWVILGVISPVLLILLIQKWH
jgi:hypothetical protein